MRSLLINIIQGCNLWKRGGCSFCFYQNGGGFPKKFTIMDLDVFDKTLDNWLSDNNQIKDLNVYFTSGEFTLLNFEYINRILNIEKKYEDKYGVRLTNHVQTNGILIDKMWASFLRDNKFRVGLSLEALPELQNSMRCNSLAETLKGLKLLQDGGYTPGVISVLTKEALICLLQGNNIEKHFKFFLDLGIHNWGYNPYITPYFSSDHIISDSDYTQFLSKAMDLWLQQPEKPVIRIREFDDLLCLTLGKRTRGCTFNESCSNFIQIDPLGDIYPCERLIGFDCYQKLGNVVFDKIINVLKNRKIGNSKGCTAMQVDGNYRYSGTTRVLINKFQEVLNHAKAA